MEYTTIKCRACGAPISYMQGAARIKCAYCATEYVREHADGDDAMRDIHYLDRGTLYHAPVPAGWSCRVFQDDQDFSWLAAVCMGLRLESSEGAELQFFPFSYYKSFNPNGAFGTGLTIRKDYQIDPASLTRYHRKWEIEEYVSGRIREIYPDAERIETARLTDLDAFLQKKAGTFARESTKALKTETRTSFGEYAVRFETANGTRLALFATVLAYKKQSEREQADEKNAKNSKNPTPAAPGSAWKNALAFGMKGGLIGAKMRGEEVSMPGVPDLSALLHAPKGLRGAFGADWGRCFDAVLLSPDGDLDRYRTMFSDFCASVQYGTQYYALQDEERAKVEEIMIRGAQERSQNAFNASQRLRQTLSETTDTINRGYSERSRVMDNVRRKQSEAVRGVNTYERADGRTVEADVKYEHVYERAGTFAGSRSAGGAELGPDWVELKRKQ